MSERHIDWELSKLKLDVFKGRRNSESLKTVLMDIAKSGIFHVEAGLNKVISGEVSIDDLFRNDPSHDFNHAMRVMKIAEHMSLVGGDIDVIRAAALLHDVVSHSKNSPGSKTETEDAAMLTRDLLEGIDFPEHKIDKVTSIITGTSLSKGRENNSDEGLILYDADKLDQTGAVGIMRYFASAGQMKREHFNPNDPFLKDKERSPEVFKYTLDALLDRLPKIEKSLAIPFVRDTAKQRNIFFDFFQTELKQEFSEESELRSLCGAEKVMKVFYKGGEDSKVFYNINDPFCEKRKPEPEIYPIDELIVSHRELLGKVTNLSHWQVPEILDT